MIRYNFIVYIFSFAIVFQTVTSAQGVAVNASGDSADVSAILDVSSITKGVLVPRMTTSQRTAISSPAAGLLVYDSTTKSFWFYNAASWIEITASNSGWSLSGNSLAGTEKLGSTNSQPVKIYSNNSERMRVTSGGQVVIGTTSAPFSSDLVTVQSTSTFPWAINSYSSNNGSAMYGQIKSGNTTGNSAIIGDYLGSGTLGVRAGIMGTLQGANNNGGAGVYGNTSLSSGNMHAGVVGANTGDGYGMGVAGIGFGGGLPTGNINYGVVGWVSNNSNYSGYFNGNHVIANGTKSASVATTKGNQLLYATESPEVWFEDVGEGQLVNGAASVNLDPLFLETVFIDGSHPMHVFIQMEGESGDVYVTKGTESFSVKEKTNGKSNAKFSYRVMAKRRNFQDHRFGSDPVWGPGDTRKYAQYAPPPPIDYQANMQLQQELKRNWHQPELPPGFKSYTEIQKEVEQNLAPANHEQQAGQK